MASRGKPSQNKPKSKKQHNSSSLTKRELLKLEKTALISKCKQLKIPIPSTATKAEMVNRIIAKSANISTPERKARDKWIKSLNEVNKYGFKKRTDLIITGFISDVDPDHQCPMDLILLFVAYIGGYLEIKFDILNDRFPDDIQDEGTLIHRKNNDHVWRSRRYGLGGNTTETRWPFCIIYACSKGFNQGTHEWHIKFKCKSNTKVPKDNIGILTNINVGEFNEYKEGNAYFISNSSKNVQYRHGDVVTIVKCKDFIPWVKNDVISVILDCDNWTVEFRINNKMVGKVLEVIKGTYYFAIESHTNNIKYKLVY